MKEEFFLLSLWVKKRYCSSSLEHKTSEGRGQDKFQDTNSLIASLWGGSLTYLDTKIATSSPYTKPLGGDQCFQPGLSSNWLQSWPHIPLYPYCRGVKLIFTRGHISLIVTFKGPNVILGLYECNYSLPGGKELSTATRQKQGAGQIKQGGGPDSACRPCVCHLFLTGIYSSITQSTKLPVHMDHLLVPGI